MSVDRLDLLARAREAIATFGTKAVVELELPGACAKLGESRALYKGGPTGTVILECEHTVIVRFSALALAAGIKGGLS